MNDVARAQLTLQMLTLLKNNDSLRAYANANASQTIP